MIVLPSRNWLIMQPPHTMSRALHKAMCSQHGAMWHIGHTPDWAAVDHHTTLMTYGMRELNRAIVVRDPFDRAVGLWHHLVQFNSKNGYGCSDFSKFATWLRDDDPDGKLSWMYKYTISKWIGDTEFSVALRFENLVDDIASIVGVKVELGNETRSKRGPLENYYRDQETIDAVASWAAEDLERFNYPMLELAG